MVAHASPLIGITSWVPGQRLLDDFVVDRPLGAGGMGVVYLVRSESTGQRFAVKKTDENEARPRHALLTELRTLTDLPHHPHLVTYCFFRTIEGAVALFTEFVAGGTLGDSVRNGKLTRLDQILDVAIQSAWGLHAVHELGFVHQDVKPPNLLLTPDGVVKVADFGLASICSAGLTEPLTGGGSDTLTDGLNTIEYCAPEQAAGGRVTRKCDVWSWGVSVLEMFYGGPPCGAGPLGAGPLAAFVLDDFLVRGNGADGRPAISLALADVLRGCFRDDPSDRPASMADVAEEVRSIYRCETGAEHPRPVPAAPRPAGGARGPERTTPFRLEWEDPAEALREALRDAGRAPAEADPFLPPRAGSRRAFAVADLEPYGEAIRVYERLAATGRSGFEARLSQLYMGKAYVHETLSDLPGTIACCDRAIEIRERLTDGRPDAGGHLAAALVYKGVTLWTLRDPRAAAAVYDRAIETCGRPGGAAGAGGRTLAMACLNKAVALRELGDLAGAVALYDRATGIYEALPDEAARRESSHDLAMACLNKAVALRELGDLAGAVALYDRATGIYEQLVGAGRRELRGDLALTYTNKGVALAAGGDGSAALALYDRAIAGYETLVSHEGREEFRHDLARAYLNKANSLGDAGDDRAAVALYDRAIAVRERMVNDEGQRGLAGDLARAYSCKAVSLERLGDDRGAAELYSRAVRIYEGLALPDEGRDVRAELGRTRLYLADVLLRVGGYAEATAAAREGLAVLRAELARTGRSGLAQVIDWAACTFAVTCLRRASELWKAGDLAPAADVLDLAIEIWSGVVEVDGRREFACQLARAYGNKALVADDMGDVPAALTAFDLSLALWEELVSRDGRDEFEADLATAYAHKAGTMDALGETEAAVGLFDRAIAARERVLARAPTPAAASELAKAYLQQSVAVAGLGDVEASEALAGRAVDVCDRLLTPEMRQPVAGEFARAKAFRAEARLGRGEVDAAGVEAQEAVAELRAAVDGGRPDLEPALRWAIKTLSSVL